MNINKILKITAVVLLLSLSACTVKEEPNPNQPTDEVVLTALSDQLNVDGNYTVLSKFKIVSHAPEGIHDDVVTTFTLKNAFGLFDLKAALRFLKKGTGFELYSVDIETLSAKVSAAPVASNAEETDILGDHDSFYNYGFTEKLMFGEGGSLGCLLVDQNYEDGNTLVDCMTQFVLLDTTAIGTTRFKGAFDFKKHWTYSFDSWTYTETVEFQKPLIFTFGSTMTGSSPLFSPEETVTLSLSGKLIITYPGTETRTVDNQMSGTLDRNGILFPVTVEVVDDYSGYQLEIMFGSRPEEVLFLRSESYGGRCGEIPPPTYFLIDAYGNTANWMNDGYTHSGTINTMSETECGA